MPDAAALPVMLKALRLPTMTCHWKQLQETALSKNWTMAEFLAALCEHELAHRETRRLARHLHESKLLPGKTLHHFDFPACPGVNANLITQLAQDSGWVEKAENVLLFGPSGVGKTHLAAAIGHGLIQSGQRVLHTATTMLVQKLQVAKRELRLSEALGKMDKYRLLILDDIGYVKKSEMESSVLFELIAHRYESGSLLITANHPFSEWDSIFPDSIMTVAAIDRLVHHATIIEIPGNSYRKIQSMKKKAAMKQSK